MRLGPTEINQYQRGLAIQTAADFGAQLICEFLQTFQLFNDS